MNFPSSFPASRGSIGESPAPAGFKVNISRGDRVGRVSSEWLSRPDDERYLSLSELHAAVRGRADRATARTVTSIIGFAELLAVEACENPRHRPWIGRIEEASRGLLVIVNDVLDFSKLEDNSLGLDARPFALRILLAQTVDLLAPQAEKSAINLTLTLDDSVPQRVLGDADRIRQILLNLISNAVKFTREGGVCVRAHYGASAGGLTIEVENSGAGIPPAALTAIFDRFGQGDGSIARQFGGTGLGLAISKRLVEMMGGQITVESTVGVGSTFQFNAPLGIDDEAAAPAIKPAVLGTIGALHVLLAEDVEANQELICVILQAAGVAVTVVSNGVEAVEAVQKIDFDLVLMDMQMPIMGGLEATRLIRGLGGAPARLPIIALSANVLPAHIADGRRAGMDAHVGKPINPRELLSAIAQWAEAKDETTGA